MKGDPRRVASVKFGYSKVLPRMKIFIWLMILNKILTIDKILTKSSAKKNTNLVSVVKEALADEKLAAKPLEQKSVAQVEAYCGTALGNKLIPLQGCSSNMDVTAALAAGYNMEESIFRSLEYDPDEDAFTVDENVKLNAI